MTKDVIGKGLITKENLGLIKEISKHFLSCREKTLSAKAFFLGNTENPWIVNPGSDF